MCAFPSLQTHISILEQQHHSNGYFSYEETPSLNDQVRASVRLHIMRTILLSSSIPSINIPKKMLWRSRSSWSKSLPTDTFVSKTLRCRKREYELEQLREQLHEHQQGADERFGHTKHQVAGHYGHFVLRSHRSSSRSCKMSNRNFRLSKPIETSSVSNCKPYKTKTS